MSITKLWKMIIRFESAGPLGVQKGRGHKGIKHLKIEVFPTAVVNEETTNVQATRCAKAKSQSY